MASIPKFHANGKVLEQTISTNVDSELAKYYLEKTLSPSTPANTSYEALLQKIHRQSDPKVLDWHLLKEVSDETSPDVATLYFIQRLQLEPNNARFQKQFLAECQRIKGASDQSVSQDLQALYRKYKILVVGGFHYASDTSTGADLASARTLLKKMGIDVELITTDEDGIIEENAAIIAQVIKSVSEKQLILVSASKGGPEIAYALGKLLSETEANHVHAWVSIGGILRGTLLADSASTFPKSWFAKIFFFLQGINSKSVKGMTAVASRKRFDELSFPKHILTVQYIGAPLSGQVSRDVRGRYAKLRAYGPNDGLTLLADELVPGGTVMVDTGLDHYYRHSEIDIKTLALTNLVLKELASKVR